MSKVYIYADPHYYHGKIIDYEHRGFANVQEMNAHLIHKHNEAITKHDRVFILGDFALTNKDNTKKIINQLKGYKTLIMGNHDKARSRDWWLDVGFNEVSKYPIIYKEFYILSHEPIYMNQHMPYLNIHGHIHSNTIAQDFYYNACLDIHNFEPILFDEIVKEIAAKVNSEV